MGNPALRLVSPIPRWSWNRPQDRGWEGVEAFKKVPDRVPARFAASSVSLFALLDAMLQSVHSSTNQTK
jgi:hypothetical protein